MYKSMLILAAIHFDPSIADHTETVGQMKMIQLLLLESVPILLNSVDQEQTACVV